MPPPHCKHRKIVIDPATGVPASSQAVLDARDLFAETMFETCTGLVLTDLLVYGIQLSPPQNDQSRFAEWQKYDPTSIAKNTLLVETTISTLQNAGNIIPGIYEDERQFLSNFGNAYGLWRATPSTVLGAAGNGYYNDVDPLIGSSYAINSYYGENLFVPQFGLDLQITSWNNFADSVPGFLNHMETDGLNNDIVCPAIDVNGTADANIGAGNGLRKDAYFNGEFTSKTVDDFGGDYNLFNAYIESDIIAWLASSPSDIGGDGSSVLNVEDTVAYASFVTDGTPQQQADGLTAFNRLRDAMREAVRFFRVGGPYETKASLLRPSNGTTGLAALGAFGDAQYKFALKQVANTQFSAQEIHDLGIEQTLNIQTEMVELVNTWIIPNPEYNPGGLAPVADWTDFITRFRADTDGFQSLFVVDTTVRTLVDETTIMIAEAQAAVINVFQNYPRIPGVELVPVPGFSLYYAVGATYAIDGTGKVLLTNGQYVFATLSNTDPVDYNETITVQRSFESSTAYHEGYPGHVYQIALQNGWPPALGSTYVVGPGEGWALYAEKVAADDLKLAIPGESRNGVYRRYDFLLNRLLRANRLVIDTALHAQGLTNTLPAPYNVLPWSRDKANEWFLLNNPYAFEYIYSESDRYTSWPGQACGYLIGALAIEKERKRAEDALGALFDLREFHDVITHFTVNVESVTTQLVNWYIAQKLLGCFEKNWPPITRQIAKPPLGSVISCDPTSSNKQCGC